MVSIAVMQPYFLPYAGYFRLFARTDLVCLFDCVQFPRRGWVHRNQLPGAGGIARWLTLPLATAPMDVRIADLAFADNAPEAIKIRCGAFPVLRDVRHRLLDAMLAPHGDVVNYLSRLLAIVCDETGLPFNVMRTTSLQIPNAFSGQDRVIEICRRLGATRYVNLAGGRRLYDAATFERHGIDLEFLDDWRGPIWSMLYRLVTEQANQIGQEVRVG